MGNLLWLVVCVVGRLSCVPVTHESEFAFHLNRLDEATAFRSKRGSSPRRARRICRGEDGFVRRYVEVVVAPERFSDSSSARDILLLRIRRMNGDRLDTDGIFFFGQDAGKRSSRGNYRTERTGYRRDEISLFRPGLSFIQSIMSQMLIVSEKRRSEKALDRMDRIYRMNSRAVELISVL
jgi:hypothetical protein